MSATQLGLFSEVTVHCFLLSCPATATGVTADEAHDAMELHYAAAHPVLIQRLADGISAS